MNIEKLDRQFERKAKRTERIVTSKAYRTINKKFKALTHTYDYCDIYNLTMAYCELALVKAEIPENVGKKILAIVQDLILDIKAEDVVDQQMIHGYDKLAKEKEMDEYELFIERASADGKDPNDVKAMEDAYKSGKEMEFWEIVFRLYPDKNKTKLLGDNNPVRKLISK